MGDITLVPTFVEKLPISLYQQLLTTEFSKITTLTALRNFPRIRQKPQYGSAWVHGLRLVVRFKRLTLSLGHVSFAWRPFCPVLPSARFYLYLTYQFITQQSTHIRVSSYPNNFSSAADQCCNTVFINTPKHSRLSQPLPQTPVKSTVSTETF